MRVRAPWVKLTEVKTPNLGRGLHGWLSDVQNLGLECVHAIR
jgi:hypothetical protein